MNVSEPEPPGDSPPERLSFDRDTFTGRFVSRAGAPVRVRLIRPEDADLLIDLFQHLSSQSRRRRFHIGMDKLSPERLRAEAERLAGVDNRNDAGAVLALLEAADTDVLLGVARLARVPEASDTAEAAVVVRDDYQNQGIGELLLRLLVDLARRMGVGTLTATTQADNEPIFALLRKLDTPVELHTSRGETTIRIVAPG